MATAEKLTARWTRFQNRVAARRAVLGRPATAFVSRPEPRTIGSYARGRQLAAGNFLFAGHLLQQPDTDMWELTPPDHAVAEALHGFGWLDDLVAATQPRFMRLRAEFWMRGGIDTHVIVEHRADNWH